VNNSEMPASKKMKMSPAKLGVIIGAIFSVLGTVAGFYFGVVRPALSSGQAHDLPVHSIWVGGILLAFLIAVCAFYLWRWIRGPQTPPAGLDKDDW